MKNVRALAVVLSATLSGCATQPIPASAAKWVPLENQLLFHEPQPVQSTGSESADYEASLDKAVEAAREAAAREPTTVPVTVLRDSGFADAVWSAHVLVNGRPAAYVGAGEKVTLHIPPGRYVVEAAVAGGPNRSESILIVQPGRPLYYRIRFAGSKIFIYPWVNYGN